MKKIVPVIFIILLVTVIAVNIPFTIRMRKENEEMRKQADTMRANRESEEEKKLETWEDNLKTEVPEAEEKKLKLTDSYWLDYTYQGNECEITVHGNVIVPKAPLYRYRVKVEDVDVTAEKMIGLLMDGEPRYEPDIKYSHYIYETEEQYQSLAEDLNYFYIKYKAVPENAEQFYDTVTEEEAGKDCLAFLESAGIPVYEEYYEVNQVYSEFCNVPVYAFVFFGVCDGVRISNSSYGTGDPVVDLLDGELIQILYGPEGICSFYDIRHRSAERVGEEITRDMLLTPEEACKAFVDQNDFFSSNIGIDEIWLVYMAGTEEGDKKVGEKYLPFWELHCIDGNIRLVDALSGEAYW